MVKNDDFRPPEEVKPSKTVTCTGSLEVVCTSVYTCRTWTVFKMAKNDILDHPDPHRPLQVPWAGSRKRVRDPQKGPRTPPQDVKNGQNDDFWSPDMFGTVQHASRVHNVQAHSRLCVQVCRFRPGYPDTKKHENHHFCTPDKSTGSIHRMSKMVKIVKNGQKWSKTTCVHMYTHVHTTSSDPVHVCVHMCVHMYTCRRVQNQKNRRFWTQDPDPDPPCTPSSDPIKCPRTSGPPPQDVKNVKK
jgi:hypothetical protein